MTDKTQSGTGAFIYGVASYGLFLAVFLYAIGFIGGFFTPTILDGEATRPVLEALSIDLGLLTLFALQHSVMARPAFKRWWTKYVPEAIERSTYVLFSSLALVALFWLWQPIGGVVWATEGFARNVVIGIYLFGWALLLYSTFLIDHFDLFGLKQVWRRLKGAEYVPPQFYTPGLYRVVRHPLYVGWLTIFWAAPTMTVAHLVFALVTTAYILFAIQLEERDLVDAFGDRYVRYRQKTPMLVPRMWGQSSEPHETAEA
ncbi:methanethiol S-methyltransferase [Sphingomonas sp. HDW15A]|uniref:methanethiol S-methyltransferase n=1 Tax=Sphingomonas sp. HDW15A TaxID=2714942 RepID=UPI0019D01E95|nr:methanethiol S-methyltransferase [Sphingomonas sp. HDW15A]